MALLPDRDAAKRRLANQAPAPPIVAAPDPQPGSGGTAVPMGKRRSQRRAARKAAKRQNGT